MSFTETGIEFIKIVEGEAGFYMTDGIRLVPRAALEISDKCPANTKYLILDAIQNGSVKVVAYVKDREYTWEKLSD
jgi:hypothetical protein